jgi:predicted RNA-binding protein associated with RNAse of E/G family
VTAGAEPLEAVVEIKRTLAGVERRFECRRLAGDARHAVLLWISSEPMHVHGVDLPAGTMSFAHFWIDRYYNVYHWIDPARRTIGLYFNLADSTRISAGRLQWRDLAIDVLATPGGRLEVLDEDELPATLDAEAAAHISAGKAAILSAPAETIAEIEAASRALFARAFTADRP